MFEDVPAGQVINAVQAHDFADPATRFTERIDAVLALERVIRTAEERKARHIAALRAIGLNADGQPLSG